MIMSQQEVINVMKGNRWYSLDELTDEVGRSKNSILVCLNKIDSSCGYVIEKKRIDGCKKLYRLTKKEEEVL
jgi:biotin operon repressor